MGYGYRSVAVVGRRWTAHDGRWSGQEWDSVYVADSCVDMWTVAVVQCRKVCFI